jgi:hypothetical protein
LDADCEGLMAAKDVKDIRITDSYVRKLVERVRRASGEKTMAKTASRLILERITTMDQISVVPQSDRKSGKSVASTAA